MTVAWLPGPPPGRGTWWVVWHDRVHLVAIEPAMINRHDPNAPLLIKVLGGIAYDFVGQSCFITHHVAVERPEAP